MSQVSGEAEQGIEHTVVRMVYFFFQLSFFRCTEDVTGKSVRAQRKAKGSSVTKSGVSGDAAADIAHGRGTL